MQAHDVARLRRAEARMTKQSLTIRLTPLARARLSGDAAARGISLSDAVEELVLRAPVRASSATAVAMRPLAQIGHRIAVALGALPDGVDISRAHLLAAKRLVALALVSVAPAFDREIAESAGKYDEWTG